MFLFYDSLLTVTTTINLTYNLCCLFMAVSKLALENQKVLWFSINLLNMIKTCEICDAESKYKCPTCSIYYCSTMCCKKHKEKNCGGDNILKKAIQDEEQSEKRKMTKIDNIVPKTSLEQLKTNKEVKDLLDNPHLRNLLVTIDKAENAEAIMQKAMQEPIFVEFADACLRVVEPKE